MGLRVLLLPALLLVMPVEAQMLRTTPTRPAGAERGALDLLRAAGPLNDLLSPMPSPWGYRELGVFCRLEVRLERRLRVPVLIRLGDVLRVEAMEGKGPLRETPLR